MFSNISGKLKNYAENVSSSLWFVPAIIVIAIAGLSFLALALDHRFLDIRSPWLFNGSPSAARSLLSTIAGAVITVISIAFSLTIVALQQASVQFSPRVIRNFTDDKGNQVVLGTYIATFLYSLLVLRAVRDSGDSSNEVAFAPAIATTITLVLAVICVAMLIYFINHVARALQAITIINHVHNELNEQVDILYPYPYAREPETLPTPPIMTFPYNPELSVQAPRAGFVVSIKESSFKQLDFTKTAQLVVLPKVGDFVSQNQTLAYVSGYSGLSDERRDVIVAAIIIGKQRSIKQDPLFAVRQLVDIALKALSPGINDPTTASYCLHFLGDSLGRIAGRTLPLPRNLFNDDTTTVYFNKPTWPEFLQAGLSQIQHEARTNPAVSKTLVKTIGRIIENTPSAARAEPLEVFIRTAREQLEASSFNDSDRRELSAVIDETETMLGRLK